MQIIGQLLMGLFVGIVAKLLTPGRDPGGIIVTILLGMGGAWVGGRISESMGWARGKQGAGCLMSVVGAIILLILYRIIVGI